MRTGEEVRVRAGLMVVVAALALGSCSLARSSGQTNFIVDFTSPNATAARATVAGRCGHLPGVTEVPPRAHDVSVYFDIQQASSRQVNALSNCVNQLSAADKNLGIRGYRIDDGSIS